jgi:tight adherence protein C
LLILVLVWLGLILIFFYFKTRTKHGKNISKNYYKDRKFKLNDEKPWIKILDDYLKEAGYVFTVESFILIHLISFILMLYGVNKLGFHRASRSIIPIMLILIVLINMLIRKKAKDRKNRIRLELCNIQDVMYFQNKIGTPEDVTLTYASRIAQEPLKEPLEYLATAPKVKKSIENALEELRSVSSVAELQSFSFILQQRQETGSSIENHKAQAQMMKRNKRLRKKITRQYKRTKLVIASLMLFVCYVLLLTVPLFIEMMRSLDLMFR